MLKESESLPQLLDGVIVHDLSTIGDHRGYLAEIYRNEWRSSSQPVQWNLGKSHANALRAAHLHRIRTDFLLLIQGKVFVGIKDIRRNSPTEGLASSFYVNSENLQLIIIPPGIIHGFYYLENSILLQGMDHCWDPTDELTCHWRDAELQIPWPCDDPILSERDRNASGFRELLADFELSLCKQK